MQRSPNNEIAARQSVEGILFGATLTWSEPLTALLRSAQSRVSSSRSLSKRLRGHLHPPSHESLNKGRAWRCGNPRSLSTRASAPSAARHPRAKLAVRQNRRTDQRHARSQGSHKGGGGCPRRRRPRARPRRPATEQSEGAHLGAPTSARRRRRGRPPPTGASAKVARRVSGFSSRGATERCRDPHRRFALGRRLPTSSRA